MIIGTPDEWQGTTKQIRHFAGSQWLASIGEACKSAPTLALPHHNLNLSNIDFITLFSAVGMTAMLDEVLNKASVDIDLKGESTLRLLAPHEFIETDQHHPDWKYAGDDQHPEYNQARRMYKVSGFLESLRTQAVLNRPGRGNEASYLWLGEKGAQLKAFATRADGKQTVIMPLMRIETKAHCKQFLDREQIITWREAMGDRFRSSPLFESEEIWRIFCHELSVNVFEHANSAGFLAARVVEHDDLRESWCLMSYPRKIQELFPSMDSGFLELCISDAGQGFAATLGEAYRQRASLKPDVEISPIDILQFAFDEVGTCKKAGESWATERHALGRILQIVAKYGGALTLRSSGAEVIYISHGGPCERIPNHFGYRAQSTRLLPKLHGSHLQVILPIVPFIHEKEDDWRQSILFSSLPSGFHTDPTHVRGHLVPLWEALDSQDACVGLEDLLEFRKRCETLAKKLIEERPPLEPIILDFSNLNWTAAQFETLLHLLQNVIQNRPVLLVEIDNALVNEVVEMEKTSATQLKPELADRTPSVTGRAYAEFSERDFLETYHRVHATVLGLDIHGNPHVFGIRHKWCESVLLSLIDSPQTLEDLCRGKTPEEQRVQCLVGRCLSWSSTSVCELGMRTRKDISWGCHCCSDATPQSDPLPLASCRAATCSTRTASTDVAPRRNSILGTRPRLSSAAPICRAN